MNDNYIKININKKMIKLNDINKFILDKIEIMKIILEKKILLNHNFENFKYTFMKIINILWNTKIKYSFIDNDNNDFIKFKNKLMKMLLNDSLIKKQFIKYIRDKKIEWNKNDYKKWLKIIYIFLKKIIILIYIIYNQLMKIKELIIIMIKN